jgi:hypothetical protein
MKRSPENGVDFIKTVGCVRHPKLKLQHRMFLTTLGQFATYKTGRNAYPGAVYLEQATGATWQTINRCAKHCEELGLIRRVEIGHKGRNTEWVFCLEHDAYPETYPGRSSTGEDQNRSSLRDDQSSIQKPIGRQFQEPKVVSSAGQTPDRSSLCEAPPQTTSTTTSSSSPVKVEVVEGDVRRETIAEQSIAAKKPAPLAAPDAAQFRELKRKMQAFAIETWGAFKAIDKQWAQTQPLMQDYGLEVVLATWEYFCLTGGSGLTYELVGFNSEFATKLAALENGDSPKYNEQRQTVWNVRKKIFFMLMSLGYSRGFLDLLTSAERDAIERHRQQTRSGEIEKLDLGTAGQLLSIHQRQEQFAREHKQEWDKQYEREMAEMEATPMSEEERLELEELRKQW